MEYIQYGDSFVIRFEEDEVFPDRLLDFLAAKLIAGASFTGIGAVKRARIAYFNVESREYEPLDLDEQLEVLALVGNVSMHNEQPLVHAHITLGRRDGTALGGHLQQGVIRPTLEVSLRVCPEPLQRVTDPKFGLPTLHLTSRFP